MLYFPEGSAWLCWEPFCDVLYDANANLKHHNTIYVIHFKNAILLSIYSNCACYLQVRVCNSHDGILCHVFWQMCTDMSAEPAACIVPTNL